MVRTTLELHHHTQVLALMCPTGVLSGLVRMGNLWVWPRFWRWLAAC